MSEQHITLKTVYDLRVNAADDPIRYYIPAYQRGYRWTATQVTQLLDDIREFTQRENPQPQEFYCLQPLVLRVRQDGAYEVVDGQQRLTTLLLTLRHFNERASTEYRTKIYTLQYETHPDLSTFLDNPDDMRAASNIDFFHIAGAVRTIKEWFKKRENEVDAIKSALLNQTKIIWFELSPLENAVAAFTRLNVGKIPLTNGELIRALFLKRSKGHAAEALQLRIAYEWDLLEKTLQGGDFWAFVSNDIAKQGARIDFLFKLVARQEGMKPSADDYATFNHFSEKLSPKDADREEAWLAVKRTFMLLEEWFQDRRLYHLVGFLIWSGMDVNDIRAIADGSTKEVFKEKLRETIRDRALGLGAPSDSTKFREWIVEQVDGLEYPGSSNRIRSILLLFNLATLLENTQSNMRFQFESFKTAMWDIEHVRSVAPDRPNSDKGQTEWLKHCLGYLEQTGEASKLEKQIGASLALPTKEARQANFDLLYEKILRHFHEADTEEPNHGIDNLVLLDYATNRSYKNAVFAVKRHRILSLDRHGTFVPLCTRNVFLKSYTLRVDHVMFWAEQDSDGYRNVLIDTLHRFFTGASIYE
jgi:Protein of unknown function DUF262